MRYKTEKNPLSIYIGDGVESQDCLYCCDEMLNIVVSLQGNTKVQVGEKERTLKEGELQIINKFNLFIVFRSEINVFLVFKIDPAYFNKFYPGFSDMVYKTNGISGDWQLLELIAEIVMLLQSEDQEYRLQLESSILQIGLELHRNYAGDKIKHQKDSKNYNERIAVYIGKHYCEPIMLSDLAKYVHLNEQYLSRHFSNLMGITISDYINIQRLYHSLDLLKNTDENILDIALQCGFVNVKSYYKVCKKYLGVTPVATCQGHIHHFSLFFFDFLCFPCSKSWRMTRLNLSSTLWVLVSEKCTSTKYLVLSIVCCKQGVNRPVVLV